MITARTDVFGVMGFPAGHSLSPQIHDYFARKTGQDMCYAAFCVLPGRLGEAVAGAHSLGIKGLNVTIPHKQACLPFLSRLDETARRSGAANTLVYEENGYAGYNTDYFGMHMSLKALGADLKGKSVVIIGAGGTAHTACVMAADMGASSITIANRTPENAESLAGRAGALCGLPVTAAPLSGLQGIARKDIVIQTSSAGFKDQADICPVESESFFEGVSAALELIYVPWESKFLRMAKSKGVPAANGFPALVFQAAASFEIWRGVVFTEDFLRQAAADLETLARPA